MPPRPDRPTRATLATLGSPPGPGPHRIRARPTPKRSAGKPARITQDTIATGVTAGPVHFGTGTTTCSDTEAASARTDRPRSPLTGDTTPIGRDLGSGEPPRGRLVTRAFAPSFVGFRREWIRSDVLAGLTVWAVLVPESLAYATIAGVPPVVGLYAAVPALVLYAVVGSSRHLVVSPMSATAALSAGVVATIGGSGDVVALTTGLVDKPKSHHLDRRAADLAERGAAGGNPDDLLNTTEVAEWLGRGLSADPGERFADAIAMQSAWRDAVQSFFDREHRTPWWRRLIAGETADVVWTDEGA